MRHEDRKKPKRNRFIIADPNHPRYGERGTVMSGTFEGKQLTVNMVMDSDNVTIEINADSLRKV